MALLDGIESTSYDLSVGRARVLSAGSGPVVLLVHGWPASAVLWRHVIRELSATHRVLAPDLPGCGATQINEGFGFAFSDYALFFDELLEQLGITEIGLCVHDAGGPIGMSWAGQWSGRVERLCLLNTLVFPGLSWAAKAFFLAARLPLASLTLASPSSVRGGFRVGVRSRKVDPEALDAYVEPFRDPARRAQYLQAVRTIGRSSLDHLPDAVDRIAQGPVGLFYGTRDVILPDVARTMSRLAERYPHARTSAWPDLGHFVQEDAPDRVAQTVASFFRGGVEPGE